MKLSKAICQHCRNKGFRWVIKWGSISPVRRRGNACTDDQLWDDEGTVFCPYLCGWASIHDWPHKDCRYAVEHIASYEAEEGQESVQEEDQ